MRTYFYWVWLLLAVFFPPSLSAADKPRLELQNEDRVVFIGGVFMEREQEDGYIETMLTVSFPDKDLSFRNLGWGGDTVESHLHPTVPARPTYVPKLLDYVAQLQPTVIFVSYGLMEAFRGEAGLADFAKNYRALLDKLRETTQRIVVISPFRGEKLGGFQPDPTVLNQNIKLYADAAEQIAWERGLVFVNLWDALPMFPEALSPLTSNGVHLNSHGYRQVAAVIQKELGLAPFVSFPKRDFTWGERLRPAIKHKNQQWWFHYRPMNSEYVYPGGTRYQNELGTIKQPMYDEIQLFAYMAEVEETGIHILRQQLVSGTVKQSAAAGPSAGGKGEKNPSKNSSVSRPTARRQHLAPDPEAERKTFQVAEDFAVNLFAADPLISKPVQMAFDAQGRLWVACTTLYPQIKPGEELTDKIIILEDRDHDGRADKTTVFADGLHIPTGILPVKNGAYVSDDTKIYFLRDTDDDGKADEREVVLSGFGTEDSHHKAHVFRWDPHGRFHFNTGVFLHNNIETAHGLVSLSGFWQAGILAYRPETGKLDLHLANSVPPNPWGHYWNRWGFDFHIDSSGQQGSNFILPTAQRTSSALPVPGGQGKLSGGELISSRHFPDDWQGNLVAAPFKENRLGRWEVSDDSSGYAMKQMPSVIVSTDPAFRPVDHRLGPEGALYVADWYNPLIGHMQHHFRDPGRDFTHGRIWRITAKNRPLVPLPKIVKASLPQLLENLKVPEDSTRLHSRRELAERPRKAVASALSQWLRKLDPADPHYDHHRLEALWVYENMRLVEPELLQSLLAAQEPNARAAALVVLQNWRDQLPSPWPLLEPLVRDEHPRVRLQAVIALSYFPEKRAMELAARVLEKPMDNYLEQALKNTAVALKAAWEPAFAAGEILFDGDGKKLEFVLQATGTQANPKSLLALLKLNQVSPENFDQAIATLARHGDKADLSALYRIDFPGEQQAKVLAGLTQAARERNITITVNEESGKRLATWLNPADESLQAEAMRLIGAWKGALFLDRFIAVAKNTAASEKLRLAAVAALSSLGAAEEWTGKLSQTGMALYEVANSQSPMTVRRAAMDGLASISLVNGVDCVLNALAVNLPEKEVFTLLQIVLPRKSAADHMASILEVSEKSMPYPTKDNARLALRFLQMTGRMADPQYARLVRQWSKVAQVETGAVAVTREALAEMTQQAQTQGDPARGEQIFRRPELMCFQCHALGGAGGMLGPELGAVGSGSQVDYLIESLLQPNQIIKDGFETWEITTQDDEAVLGIKVRENPQEVVLKDAVRPEIVIPKNSIKSQTNKKTSLMPSGLTTALTDAEMLDLVRFLSELGKPGAYANNPKALVRRWKVANTSLPGALDMTQPLVWEPAYSLVSGVLPLEELSKIVKPSLALARCEIEVTTPGKIQFYVNSIDGLLASVNGQAVELKPATILDLPRGLHQIVFSVDAAKRKDGLLVEFDQIPNSPGRFQLVSGK